ncbi:MAG TPA: lipid-binding SYLF domain-containing protein [Candidatus Angelobacter sp.]|nr:lipid-binding SYLF domain-containing protein [Candidatus Angelobacter sp.]
MRRINAMLLFLGCITGLMAAQQPPSPPPPPPAASQPPSAQPADAAQAAQQVQQQQQQMQEQIQQQQQQIERLQQQLHQQQQAAPAQQTQQNPTEPALPSQTQQDVKQAAAEDTKNLPESDKLDAQRAEAQRAEAQKQLDEIQNKEELAELRVKDQGRLRESRAVLKELLTGTSGKVGIPNALLRQSRCVVVIPAVKKAAVGFGANYGRGVMSCRLGEDFNGQWSAPAMYALEGGNFGFQIGLKGTDLVLLIINGRGADSILRSKVKLGGDMSVAAGPIGRSAEASTDLAMKAKILSYSRAHGIFAGVALDGSTLRPDNRANEALYGREISAREIVRSGAVTPPTGSLPLLRLLEQSASASAETKPSAQAQSQAQHK